MTSTRSTRRTTTRWTPTGVGTVGGCHVLVHGICPVHVSERLSTVAQDRDGDALAMEALAHAGPASAGRIDRSVCRQAVVPGNDPVAVVGTCLTAVQQVVVAPHVPAEPALASYATASR